MNTPATALACSSCGALYSPAPGDRSLCSACRRLLPSEPPWRGDEESPRPVPVKPAGAALRRPGGGSPLRASFVRGRALRRIAIAAAGVSLVAGLGAWLTLG